MSDPVAMVLPYVLLALTFAMAAGLYRVAFGPGPADRILALDLMGTLAAGLIAVVSILDNEALYLRGAMILALLAFLGTIAFARHMERSGAE